LYYSPSHRFNVCMMLSSITFFMIFAVFDLLSLTLCAKCSFLHLYLCHIIRFEYTVNQ